MKGFQRLGRAGRVLVGVAVAGAIFGIASAVQASIPDSSGVIHGCYNKKGAGELRVIDPSAPKQNSCTKSEAALNWNVKGVTGPSGPSGSSGPAGPSGPGTVLAGSSGGADLLTEGFIGVGVVSADEPTAEQVISVSGTLQDLYVHLATAPGTGHIRAFEVFVNGVFPGRGTPVCTIEDMETSCSDTFPFETASVSAGDTISIREIDQLLGGSAATAASWSVKIS